MGSGLVLALLLAARLAVPQPIAPETVPLPVIDGEALARETALQRQLVDAASRGPMSVEVRAVGELIRRIGAAESVLDVDEVTFRRRALTRQARRVLTAEGPESLLRLRALQTHLFSEALTAWDGSLPVPQVLIELGGRFAERSRARVGQTSVAPQVEEVQGAYRLRWTELLGLEQHLALAPSVNDTRLGGRLGLRWAEGVPVAPARELRLRAIERLAKVDPTYPVAFALGVTHFAAGSYDQAFEQFAKHLQDRPDGPWTLRARNHAQAAALLLSGRTGEASEAGTADF